MELTTMTKGERKSAADLDHDMAVDESLLPMSGEEGGTNTHTLHYTNYTLPTLTTNTLSTQTAKHTLPTHTINTHYKHTLTVIRQPNASNPHIYTTFLHIL